MTADQLHDAITLLPADLVAQADQVRQNRRVVIPWKRYAAMAACFALVLCSAAALLQVRPKQSVIMEAAAPAAIESDLSDEIIAEEGLSPDEEMAAEEAPAACETLQEDCTTESSRISGAGALHPGIVDIRYVSADTAAGCYSSTPQPKLFRSRGELDAYRERSLRLQQPALSAALEECDEAWFENRDLLILTLTQIPEGEVPVITAVWEAAGTWYVSYTCRQGTNGEVLREWHVLLETDKDLIPGEDAVTLTTPVVCP